MKTLLLVGGTLLLLLGFLLLVAAVVVFAIARNKRAKSAGPQPQPGTMPSPPAAIRPPSPPAPAQADLEKTVVAQKLGFGALHGISGKVNGQTFPLQMDGFYIGRDRTLAEVVIEDASVSKRHLWVGVREGVVTAIDQSSTNGTYLNTIGTRIGQVKLTPGDTLIISDDVARLVYKV